MRSNEITPLRVRSEKIRFLSLTDSINLHAFPTLDSLHLLEQGIMKKKMLRWMGKTKAYKRKWSEEAVKSVSQTVTI